MKHLNKIALASLVLSSVIQPQAIAQEFYKAAAVEEAKATTKAFAGALQKELQGAMKAGGPINALQTCNIEAMPVTAQAGSDSGAMVSRVSLKNRNPNNVPNDWQAAILKKFDERAASGESIETMASATVEKLDNGKHQLRFMKAVPTGGVCLACHGQTIDGALQAKLDELYPDDKATGYSLGEVRGAIVVVKDY